MARKRTHQEIESATFALDQFVGIAGHDVAEAMQHRAFMQAGGSNFRRASPQEFDIRYFSALKEQLIGTSDHVDQEAQQNFWDSLKEACYRDAERRGFRAESDPNPDPRYYLSENIQGSLINAGKILGKNIMEELRDYMTPEPGYFPEPEPESKAQPEPDTPYLKPRPQSTDPEPRERRAGESGPPAGAQEVNGFKGVYLWKISDTISEESRQGPTNLSHPMNGNEAIFQRAAIGTVAPGLEGQTLQKTLTIEC